jgi:hypothetical protein
MPTPLFAVAPITPAAIVPWPLSSVALPSSLTKSYPASSRGARSGSAVTPVSTTATVIRPLPRVVSQACATRVRVIAHCAPNPGSFGATAAAYAMWSGST